jgi:hypothetical protein
MVERRRLASSIVINPALPTDRPAIRDLFHAYAATLPNDASLPAGEID